LALHCENERQRLFLLGTYAFATQEREEVEGLRELDGTLHEIAGTYETYPNAHQWACV
jgi:hypothetical protein